MRVERVGTIVTLDAVDEQRTEPRAQQVVAVDACTPRDLNAELFQEADHDGVDTW